MSCICDRDVLFFVESRYTLYVQVHHCFFKGAQTELIGIKSQDFFQVENDQKGKINSTLSVRQKLLSTVQERNQVHNYFLVNSLFINESVLVQQGSRTRDPKNAGVLRQNGRKIPKADKMQSRCICRKSRGLLEWQVWLGGSFLGLSAQGYLFPQQRIHTTLQTHLILPSTN